jgi:hypothetical protein
LINPFRSLGPSAARFACYDHTRDRAAGALPLDAAGDCNVERQAAGRRPPSERVRPNGRDPNSAIQDTWVLEWPASSAITIPTLRATDAVPFRLSARCRL